MFAWPYLLLLIPATWLAWEDFRTRRIAVVWLAELAVECFAIEIWATSGSIVLAQMAINLGLLIVLGIITSGYLCLRRYRLRETFGMGDVVMLLVLTPLFAPEEYLRFLLAACCAALLWWAVRRSATIPFAGVTSLILAGYSVYKTVGLWS